MPKSQIIKDIVEDSVSLEKSLTRLFVIAKDVNNKRLAQWAENELNGYKKLDDVPEYRHTRSTMFKYSGINGNFQVKNVPLPKGWIKSDILDAITAIVIRDGIKYIESLASSENSASRDLSELAGAIGEATDGAVSCTSIQQIISQSFYQRICAEVKNKMILALMELEKVYGNLDTLGVDISDKRPVQVEAINDDLNRTIFINLPSPETKKDPWYSKIAWNVFIPIFTAIAGAIIGAIAIQYFGL